jgi:IS6 family transposase
MQERGLSVDHTTIYRWVQRYAPEINKRIRPHLKLAGTSYRVDETYIKVGKTCTARLILQVIPSNSCFLQSVMFPQQNASLRR